MALAPPNFHDACSGDTCHLPRKDSSCPLSTFHILRVFTLLWHSMFTGGRLDRRYSTHFIEEETESGLEMFRDPVETTQ